MYSVRTECGSEGSDAGDSGETGLKKISSMYMCLLQTTHDAPVLEYLCLFLYDIFCVLAKQTIFKPHETIWNHNFSFKDVHKCQH